MNKVFSCAVCCELDASFHVVVNRGCGVVVGSANPWNSQQILYPLPTVCSSLWVYAYLPCPMCRLVFIDTYALCDVHSFRQLYTYVCTYIHAVLFTRTCINMHVLSRRHGSQPSTSPQSPQASKPVSLATFVIDSHYRIMTATEVIGSYCQQDRLTIYQFCKMLISINHKITVYSSVTRLLCIHQSLCCVR